MKVVIEMIALDKARAARLEKMAAGEKVSKFTYLERVEKYPTRKNREAVKCWQCQGEYADPSIDWRIGNCELTDCGIWPDRPHQRLAGAQIPAGLR